MNKPGQADDVEVLLPGSETNGNSRPKRMDSTIAAGRTKHRRYIAQVLTKRNRVCKIGCGAVKVGAAGIPLSAATKAVPAQVSRLSLKGEEGASLMDSLSQDPLSP